MANKKPIVNLKKHIDRRTSMLKSLIEYEPASAITRAHSLVEDVCKFILESQDKKCTGINLPTLAKETLNGLKDMITEGVPEHLITSLTEQCTTIVLKVGAVRDVVGDVHGVSSRQPRNPSSDDARFVISIALAVAQYIFHLWELTFEEKKSLGNIALEWQKNICKRKKIRRYGFDNLAYSRELEAIQTKLYLETKIRPDLGELYHSILKLRKSGWFKDHRE